MVDFFGSDVSTFRGGVAGLDPNFTIIREERAVIEAAARRLMTRRGSLPHAPEAGYDLTEKIGARVTPVMVARLKADVREELMKDERVLDARVEDLTGTVMAWSMRVALTLASGPFSLVFRVTPESVTADIATLLRSSRS